MKQNKKHLYRCAVCHSDLIALDLDTKIQCSQCKTEYPLIDGVHIMLSEPMGFVNTWISKVKADRDQLSADKNELETTKDNLDCRVRERAEKVLSGKSMNIDLVETHMSSCRDFMKGMQYKPKFSDLPYQLLCGWEPTAMLPYFYQDWGNTEQLDRVAEMFKSAVDKYATSRSHAVVIGSGAGGLLKRLSNNFETTYGVELSLPIHLIAKSMIEGNTIEYNLEARPGSLERTNISIKSRAEKKPTDIKYVAADAFNLPFPSNSVSVVVTQYITDIISAPAKLAKEIHRVLESGGIWIDLSLPFRVPSDPKLLPNRTHEEAGAFLEDNGFKVVSMDRQRYINCNTAPAIQWGGQIQHTPIFFTGRKMNKENCNTDDYFANWYKSGDPGIWELCPQLVDGREITILRGKTLSKRDKKSAMSAIQIKGLNKLFSLTPALVQGLETILELMDGTNPIRKIHNSIDIPEDELLRFCRILCRMEIIDIPTGPKTETVNLDQELTYVV
jgi:SAM-dependent methyltransferase/uncharacterized protein YbaR (Trm112 family)